MSDDFDRDLAKLYRAGACEEPPASLDRRIANAARKVERAPIWRRFLRACTGWQVGFGAFAVVVLSFSLIAVMHDQTSLAPEAGAPPLAAPAPSRPASDLAPRMEPEGVKAPSSAIWEEQRRQTQNTEVRADQASPRAKREQEAVRRARSTDDMSGKLASIPEPLIDRHAAPGSSSDQLGSARQRELGAPPSAALPVAPEAARSAEQSSVPGEPQAVPSAPPRVTQAAPKRFDPNKSKGPTTEPPEAWLGRIDKLLRAGSEQEARAEMGSFRLRYPTYPIPSNLKHLVDASNQRADEPPTPEISP